MYTRMDFDPAQNAEAEPFGVDFINDLSRLQQGLQLVGTPTATLSVLSGTDDDPASHLVGTPYVMINPFTKTGLVTLAVAQIDGVLDDVEYALQFDCATTAGTTISLWARIPPGNPPNLYPTG